MLVRLGIFGPLAVAAVAWALGTGRAGWMGMAGAFAAGLFFWTALEYLMHRFAFHGFAPHWEHHERPTEAKYILAPLGLSLPVAGGIFGVLWAAAGAGVAAAVLAGVLTGYLAYEAVHLRIHSQAAGGVLLRALRRNHYYHHFANDTKCYGVTSPLWDVILASAAKSGRTPVRPPEAV